jgi:hypothetical protein
MSINSSIGILFISLSALNCLIVKSPSWSFFRTKQYIYSDDIYNAFNGYMAKFIFLNSCNSNLLANDLHNKCTKQCIGYGFRLSNEIAVKFSCELYKLANPTTICRVRNVFNQAIININRPTNTAFGHYVLFD